jgi:putative Mn2+ efflux pump MntP
MIINTFLIAIGLSMDSLVVSIVGGATIRDCRLCHVLKIALVMAIFQGGLTLVGYFVGASFAPYIHAFDHWVAFGLLAYLGGKMIYEELSPRETERTIDLLHNRTLVCLSLATSIDAMAVGVSLAILQSPILWQTVAIGSGTFAAAAVGVCAGHRFGKKAKVTLVSLAGGAILIGIGFKILLEHLLS